LPGADQFLAYSHPESLRLTSHQITHVAIFGPRTLQGVITQQDSCAFVGTLFNTNDWVGVLSGPGGDTVNFDWGGATGTGTVSANEKQMTFTYTFTGSASVPTTACTGIGIKQ
jgi:hypothetical protein